MKGTPANRGIGTGQRFDDLHLLRRRHLRTTPAAWHVHAEDAGGAQPLDDIDGQFSLRIELRRKIPIAYVVAQCIHVGAYVSRRQRSVQ